MKLAFRKERKMSTMKLFASILLVLAVLFTQVGNVAAAPPLQDPTPVTGTVESIATETDANGVSTVLVTLVDDQGTTQTLRLSVETAVVLGLVTLDPTTKEPVVDETQVGQIVEIDPTTIPPEEPSQESVHPIAWLLGEFFNEDPNIIEGYHEDGFGFGVIAQALWISQNLTGTEIESGNVSLAEEILQAKQDKNFEAFFDAHPEYLGDGAVPTNWGQFKKSLQEKKNNLGVVVSGQEEPDTLTDPALTDEKDHGNNKNKNDKDKKEKKDKKNKP
jgi:hypothetical protein